MFDSDKIIKFEIVTPEGVVLKENIIKVTVPTREGEITILPKHMPIVSVLVPGVIELTKEDGSFEVASVSGGFIEVLRNKVVLLADTSERATDIDLKRAEEARERAEKALVGETRRFDQERFANISSKLAKELARSKAVKRWKKVNNIK